MFAPRTPEAKEVYTIWNACVRDNTEKLDAFSQRLITTEEEILYAEQDGDTDTWTKKIKEWKMVNNLVEQYTISLVSYSTVLAIFDAITAYAVDREMTEPIVDISIHAFMNETFENLQSSLGREIAQNTLSRLDIYTHVRDKSIEDILKCSVQVIQQMVDQIDAEWGTA